MTTSERVVVFIDYEYMQRCAKDVFAVGRGHFWPWKLGKLVVDKRNARVDARPSHLAGVQVYRGLRSPRREPNAHAANEAQTASGRHTITSRSPPGIDASGSPTAEIPPCPGAIASRARTSTW